MFASKESMRDYVPWQWHVVDRFRLETGRKRQRRATRFIRHLHVIFDVHVLNLPNCVNQVDARHIRDLYSNVIYFSSQIVIAVECKFRASVTGNITPE